MQSIKIKDDIQIPKYQKSTSIKINGKPFKIEEDKEEKSFIGTIFMITVSGVCIYYGFGIILVLAKSFLGYDLLASIGANTPNILVNIWAVLKWICSM